MDRWTIVGEWAPNRVENSQYHSNRDNILDFKLTILHVVPHYFV